jgi:hypothetical protein
MAGTYYGYRIPSGSHPDLRTAIATTNSINQRGTVGRKMTANGWAIKMHGRLGRVEATIPDVAMATWYANNDNGEWKPEELLGRTAAFSPGTYMDTATDGTTYSHNLQSTFQMWANNRYAIGAVGAGAKWAYGYQDHVGLITVPEDPYQAIVYRRSVTTATPQDPFGPSSSGTQGMMAIWVEYDENVPPDVPLQADAIPAHNSSISTLTPTFSADFRDANETLSNGLAGDKLSSVWIVVRRVSTNAVVWNYQYNVSPAEQAARRFSLPYGGTALIAGEQYHWACKVYDMFGTTHTLWMPDTYFTAGSGQVNTDAGTPTGTQQTKTPGPFTGVWTHPSATAMDKIKVQLVAADGTTVVQTTGDIDIANVANGGAISVSWATTGFSQLTPGTTYFYRMQGVAVGGLRSGWSNLRQFRINSAPSIPQFENPLPPETTGTSRPELRALVYDDDDTSGTGLAVSFRIKDGAGTVLFTRSAAFDAVTGRWFYQTTSTDMAAVGDFRFDAYAFDGTFYSNGNTALGTGSSPYSSEVLYHYSSGPQVTMAEPDPSDVVVTSTPTIDWTIGGGQTQTRKQVQIWDATSQTYEHLVYDSGEITSADTDHLVPPGHLADGREYWVQVTAWNTLNEPGQTAVVYFTTDFGDATAVQSFDATPHTARGDITPTAIQLTWDPTEYPDAQFESYILTRRAADDELFDVDDPIEDENRRIVVITAKSQTSWVDYLPASGVTYTYGISQIVNVTGDRIRSPIVRLEQTVDFRETIIVDARHPGARRVVLQYRGNRTIKRVNGVELKKPWGSGRPHVYRDNTWYREISAEFVVVGDTPGDVQEQMLELDKLSYYGGPHLYRDGRGRRYFGEMIDWEEIDQPGGRERQVRITFVQTAANEVEWR